MVETPKPNRRCFEPTPNYFVFSLLVLEGLLLMSERFGWFDLGKGYAVLIAFVGMGVAMLAMLLWFIASLLFRRQYQFSIRSLLLMVVAVAIPCSWLAVEMEQARKQREAVKALHRFPGPIQYDDERSQQQAEPPGPPWLHSVLGKDFFANAEFVCLGGDEEFTDAEMDHVESLVGLKVLLLCGAGITDAGVQHVEGLSQLRHLDLSGTQVTDAGLEYLTRLTQLQVLWLNGCQVTDAGLVRLNGLSHLESLNLCDTQVTDDGIKKLQEALPNCKILH